MQKKITKPKSLNGMITKKWLLWGLLSATLAMQVIILALWYMGQFNISQASQQSLNANKKESPAMNKKAQSFATQFANEFFDWGLSYEKNREKRLERFLAKGVDPQAGIDFSSLKYHARPENLEVWDITQKGENQSVITIFAEMRLYDPKKKNQTFTVKRLLAIPLQAVSQNQFVVTNTPYLKPLPQKVTTVTKKEVVPEGEEVAANEKNEIQGALENFFQVYASEKNQDLRYLTKNPIEGYQGAMRFLKLDNLTITKKKGLYQVVCDIQYRETATDIQMQYQYIVFIVKEDGRWFIQTLEHAN